MSQRIKGQELNIVFVSPTGVEESINAVQSCEFEAQMDILSEGYLGETTERKDDIFKGMHGKITFHVDTSAWFTLAGRIIDRAQRRTPGVQFNLIGTFNFPNGQRARMVLQDIYFGAIPTNTGSREDYVEATLDFECSQYRVLPA